MKKSIMLISVLVGLTATPAMADDAWGPGRPRAGEPFNGGGDIGQFRANADYQRGHRDSIIAQGGCNADIQPVWVHQGCSGGIFSKADGGSDSSGGSGSGESAGGEAH